MERNDALAISAQSIRLSLVATLILAGSAPGQTLAPDAARPASAPLLTLPEAGFVGLAFAASFALDDGVRDLVQDNRGGQSNGLARAGNTMGDGRYVLPALAAGYVAGRLADAPGVSRAALRSAEAFSLAGGLSTILKQVGGRKRPGEGADADDFHVFGGGKSFPSGHTTVAFAVATSLANEIPNRLADAALYGAAGLTGFSRLNDDKHWASDVLAGALLGHLAGAWITRGDHPLPIEIGPDSATLTLRL